MKIMQQIRKAVEQDERPQSTIAKLAGIHPKTFSAFMHGRRGLSIESIEQLVKALGMELRLELKLVKTRKNA
jgi:plasmid maintenance system antidote protein VapI